MSVHDPVVDPGHHPSCRLFAARAAFDAVGLSWQDHVVQDPRYMRPSEVSHLVGDATKAHDVLDWKAKTKLPELASLMVEHDLALCKREARDRDERNKA